MKGIIAIYNKFQITYKYIAIQIIGYIKKYFKHILESYEQVAMVLLDLYA